MKTKIKKEKEKEQLDAYDLFTKQLKIAIKPYQHEDKNSRLKLLDEQVASVFRLERSFIDVLCNSEHKITLALSFIKFLEDSGKIVTTARPFFRERNIVYVKHLLPELRRRAWTCIYKYATNWCFLLWVLGNIDLKSNVNRLTNKIEFLKYNEKFVFSDEETKKLVDIILELKKVRDSIVVQNLPLVIDRAKLFARCTPRAELTDLDLISNATEGLIVAIDKVMIECSPELHWDKSYHPVDGVVYWRGESASLPNEPFKYPQWVVSGWRVENHHTASKHKTDVQRPQCPASVFRTTAIGKMGAKMINAYSGNHLHLGPSDKRLLYHANKRAANYIVSPQGDDKHDYQEIAAHIRLDRIAWYIARDFEIDLKETEKEIHALYTKIKNESPELSYEDIWISLGIYLSSKYEEAEDIVNLTEKVADAESVANIMRASTVVPTIDDEGEDKQEREQSYSIPTEYQPESLYEREELSLHTKKILSQLSIFERKILVLANLADISCLQ